MQDREEEYTLTEETRSMPTQAQQQAPDFALFLKQKEHQTLETDMNAIITENLTALKELAK